ncbi:hypothetical protein EGR52_08820 [bacterium]|nr:hypothetical protein [bacterium]
MKNKKIKIIVAIFIVLLIIVLCFSMEVYAAYLLGATDVSYMKPDGTTVSVKEALDELYTKEKVNQSTKEIGDEVTVGGEKFYVLEWLSDSNVATLISKYELNSDGTAQSLTGVNCVFSSINYWSSSFKNSPFNLNDFEGYKDTDAIGKAKSYGKSKGAISSRLLLYEEANTLRTQMDSNSKIKNMYIIPEKSYWLASASYTYNLWVVR